MRLIADSGSTKTKWYCIKDDNINEINTRGYNPYYCNSSQIIASLQSELLPQINPLIINQIYFYGAGCSHIANQIIVIDALSFIFKNAKIEVNTDLLAAARATSVDQAGICCILGTGTNSCYYNGKTIVDNLPSLGYILGDEGSGAALGKALLQAYFYRELPPYLESKIQDFANMDRHYILDKVNRDMPSRFLASFAVFCATHQQEPCIKEMITSNFEQFIKKHLLKYKKVKELPIHFVGSIAYEFQGILRPLLEKNRLKVGLIIKTPFPQLLDYY